MNTRKHSTEKIIIFLIYHDNFIIKQYKQTIFSNLNIDCQGKVLSFYRRNVAYLKQHISHIGKIEQLQFESTPFTPLFPCFSTAISPFFKGKNIVITS